MRWKLLLLTLLSAVLFPLALPNELFLQGNPLLGLFCLSFFFWAIYETPSFRFAALLGALFGLVSTVLANYWLKNFNEFAIYTLGGTTLGYIGLNALLAPIIRGFARLKPGMRPFLTAILFTVYELLKSSGFLAYPWGLIAYPAHTILPFIQFIDITGIWGLSFLCAYINALVAETFSMRFTFLPRSISLFGDRRALMIRSKSLFALALVGIALVYGGVRLGIGFIAQKTLDVVLVQQDIDPWDAGRAINGINSAREESLRGIRASLETNKKLPDLVVWSETALRYSVDVKTEFPFKKHTFYASYFPELFTEFKTTTLTGAPVISPQAGRFHNAAILVTKDGRVADFYAKQHPVPFVESIPFLEVKPIREFFEKELGLSNFWLMGAKSNVFTLQLPDGSTVRFGTPICFEDVFPDICRSMVQNGAELLINITNDSWSEMKSALTQHTAAARFRSIETRKVMLRACNAGLTCVISPTGEITDSLPLFTKDFLLASVPVAGVGVTTLYTILGDYLPWCFALFLIVLLVGCVFEKQFSRLARKISALSRRILKRKPATRSR